MEWNVDARKKYLSELVELFDEGYAGGCLAPELLVVLAKEIHELFLLACATSQMLFVLEF